MTGTTNRNVAPALRELADLWDRRNLLDARIEALCKMSIDAIRTGKNAGPVKRSRNGIYMNLYGKLSRSDRARVREVRQTKGIDAAIEMMKREAELAASVGRPIEGH